jgi:hypothetical protein
VLGFPDLLEVDDANDLAHDLSAQIGTTADISVDRETVGHFLGQNLLSGTVSRFMEGEPSRRNPPPGSPERRSLEHAREDELQRLVSRLTYANEIINQDITDTLDPRIVMTTFGFAYDRPVQFKDYDAVDELPKEGEAEDFLAVAPVKGGIRLRVFRGDDPPYDVQLMPSVPEEQLKEPPESRENLIVVMFKKEEPSAPPELKVFGADGHAVVDTVKHPNRRDQAAHLVSEEFRRRNAGDPPTDPENNPVVVTVKTMVSAGTKTRDNIKKLIEIYERIRVRGVTYSGDRKNIIKNAMEILGLAGSMKQPFVSLGSTSTGEAKEVIHRLNDVQKTLDEVPSGWLRFGPTAPKDACYVGHACFCGRECYVWVCPDGVGALAEFTRKVLKLSTTIKDVQIVTAPSGIQFSPALTNTPR